MKRFLSEHLVTGKAALMKRCLIAIFIAVQICTTCPALANEGDSSALDNPAVAITLAELGLALNASLVASNPNDVGQFMAVFGIPYSIALTHNKESKTAKWAVPLITAAYAAYYINLDEDAKSETEIFQENMIGMHALIGIGVASGFLLNGEDDKNDFDSNLSSQRQATFMSFYPLTGGGQIRLMYRF